MPAVYRCDLYLCLRNSHICVHKRPGFGDCLLVHTLCSQVDWRLEYVNSVALIGNLGLDFEVRTVPGGLRVATNRLAVRRGDKVTTDW